MKTKELKSYQCPNCKIKWQEKINRTGITQVFNSFAFENYHDPITRQCYKCTPKDDKEGL